MTTHLLLSTLASIALTPPTALEPPALARRTPFDAGSITVSFGSSLFVGGTSDRYLVMGAGLGYYVIDGLELGLDFEHWFGADPEVTRISPEPRDPLHLPSARELPAVRRVVLSPLGGARWP
jgi:hypothetical protein